MDKKGISAIVATVLIILITVASVTIVWTTVVPMIKDNVEFSELGGGVRIVTSGGYTVYDAEGGMAMVQVERDIEDLEMKGIRIIFLIEGNSYGSSVVAPDPGETKVYTFDLSSYGQPDSVSVVPIFIVGKIEKEGDVTSKVKIPFGKIYEVDDFIYELETDYMSEDSEFSCLCDETQQNYKVYDSDGDVIYVDCWNDKCWTETSDENYVWGGHGIDESTNSCVGVADRPACNYCDNLSYGGFSDWVLPDRYDLSALCNLDSCSGTCFGGEGSMGRYWSSTEVSSNSASKVRFSDCYVYSCDKSGTYPVRCMRD